MEGDSGIRLPERFHTLRLLFEAIGDRSDLKTSVETLPTTRSLPGHIKHLLEVADKYELHGVKKRILHDLWYTATLSKQDALGVFSVAVQQQSPALARHAMRHFKDIRGLESFPWSLVTSIGANPWWYLVRAAPEKGSIVWKELANSIQFPES